MKRVISQVRIRPVVASRAACTLLAVVLLHPLAQTALADFPPRLPPEPAAQSKARPVPYGGYIRLGVRFSQAWPWASAPWQDLWTIVQWQDDKGYWHEVEGWQGGLDGVAIGESGEVIGKQVWWVAESDLGKGPFRWLICQGEGGRRLATSESFDLPGSEGRTVQVEVSLSP